MRKRFVKVMLYGALALATSTSFIGCQDYDNDVKSLQEQIDNINKKSPVTAEEMKAAIADAIASLQSQLHTALAGKADNATVVALQQKVEELTQVLDGKADAAKLTELVNEIKALSEQVNNVKGTLDQTKSVLEAEIASLKQQIANTADKEKVAQLVKDLAALQNKLEAVEKATTDNAAAIANLSSKIAALEGLKARIEALETANTATKEELTNIAAQLVGINNTLTEYNGKLNALEAKLNDYVKNTVFNDAVAKITALETWKAEAAATLLAHTNNIADNKANISKNAEEIATLVTQIGDLKEQIKGCITQNGLDNAISAASEKILADIKIDFDTLEKRVKVLEDMMKELIGRIQSIVFVPEYTDGQVSFVTLKAQDKNSALKTIAQSGDIKVKFRVSPASAAKDIEAKKYNFTFDAQELKTRAGDIFTVVGDPVAEVKGTGADAKPTGIVTFTLHSNSEKSYAVCLQIEKAAVAEGGVYTNIASNYFPAISEDIEMTNARIAYPDNYELSTQIYWNDATSNINFKPEGLYHEIYVGSAWKKLSPYGIDGNSIFTNEYTMTGNDTDFTLTNGRLKLKSYSAAADGKKVTVSSKLTISKLLQNSAEYTTQLGTVTAAHSTSTDSYTYPEKTLNWSGTTEQTEKLPLVDLANATNKTISELKTAFASSKAITPDRGVTFANDLDGDNLAVTVPTSTAAGDYVPKLVLTMGYSTITVTAHIKITNKAVAAFIKVPEFWLGDNVILVPKYDNKTKLSSITIEQDLTKLFSNYGTIETAVTGLGGTVEIKETGTLHTGMEIIRNTISVLPTTDFSTGTAKAIATAKYDQTIMQRQSMNFTFKNMSGTWTNGTTAVKFTAMDTPVTLLSGFIWKDNRGCKMWENGKVVTDGSDFSGNALNIYGLTAPKVEKVTSDYSDYFTYDPATNKVSVQSEIANIGTTGDIIVQFKLTASSKWGDFTPIETIIQVTLPQGVNK